MPPAMKDMLCIVVAEIAAVAELMSKITGEKCMVNGFLARSEEFRRLIRERSGGLWF